eukprot:CAMPEP_0117621378 /NCGR_PEP_ID=MMETSP0784-20121206/87604_1 /TAXON_ID=39447 /ORGANISM="" /LENGTH=724 /DNA_ID=CAMNT_0005425303 /DNA_START=90 /DNA_END=2264 /DNA_ORIENTATION=-
MTTLPQSRYQYTHNPNPPTIVGGNVGQQGQREYGFLANTQNWTSIADIAKALATIEADERLVIEELAKLPGGVEVLHWLRAYGPDDADGDGGPDGIERVKVRLDAMKQNAHAKAQQARAQAEEAKKAADNADKVADKALSVDAQEHGGSPQTVDPARVRELEVKKEMEAKRLADLAAQAEREAQAAHDEWQRAQTLSLQHAAHADQMKQNSQKAKEGARSLGLIGGPDEALLQADAGQRDAAQKAKDAQRARDIAAQKSAKAQELLARVGRLEQALHPGGAMQVLVQVQNLVDSAHHARILATQEQKRVEGLALLIAQLTRELEQTKRAAAQRQQEAEAEEAKANAALQQSKSTQDALGFIITPDARVPMNTIEAARAIDDVKRAAAEADQDAREHLEVAHQLDKDAQNAHQNAERLASFVRGHPNLDELDELADKAELDAEQAKARADALGPASAAAKKHAQNMRLRADRSLDLWHKHRDWIQGIGLPSMHLPGFHMPDFGLHMPGMPGMPHMPGMPGFHLPTGWFERTDPATGKTYYVSPSGQTSWDPPTLGEIALEDRKRASQMELSAKQQVEAAMRMEADANRLDELIEMLKRTMRERARLERTVLGLRDDAVRLGKNTDIMLMKVEDPAVPTTTTTVKGAGPDEVVYEVNEDGESIYKVLTDLLTVNVFSNGGSSNEEFRRSHQAGGGSATKVVTVSAPPAWSDRTEVPACGIRSGTLL